MKSKLTLSLPEKTIKDAKRIAKARRTTVSALFAASLEQWRTESGELDRSEAVKRSNMADLLGAFRQQAPFDARSARIREKHG
ncbi:MAG: hypothetical protein JJU00_17675 [Opitutales bacterium]|nr:hypothetical protein [Opitutales bacterium]